MEVPVVENESLKGLPSAAEYSTVMNKHEKSPRGDPLDALNLQRDFYLKRTVVPCSIGHCGMSDEFVES